MTTYIKGSAKEITGQYGSFLNVSFKLEDLQQHVNDRGYVNVTISPRKEVGPYGDTHSITLNEWKPDSTKSNYVQSKDIPEPAEKSIDGEEIDLESIPF